MITLVDFVEDEKSGSASGPYIPTVIPSRTNFLRRRSTTGTPVDRKDEGEVGWSVLNGTVGIRRGTGVSLIRCASILREIEDL